MTPAASPPAARDARRLLVIDPEHASFDDARASDLPGFLRRNDLIVVNDSATLPAAMDARVGQGEGSRAVEVRLLRMRDEQTWDAVLLGDGDARARTEDRAPAPRLDVGTKLSFGGELDATVTWVSTRSPRWVAITFEATGAALWREIYARGRPVQYAYVPEALSLWDVQTAYASRPWSVEAPSAGLALTASVFAAARARGVRLARLTHAAGLSSTGDASVDALLPLAERYEIPRETVDAIAHARSLGGRVIAVGTTVVRALEGCATSHRGELVAGVGVTSLRIGAAFHPTIVTGIFTGLHEEAASHFDLLCAFAPLALLKKAYAHAEAVGYLGHELGDANLILPRA